MKNLMQNETNRTAIAYYRYSSHRQGEQSIEGQRDEAVKWATANGYTIVKEYADRAMTGTNDDRIAFQTMLRELEKLRPAALILWKVDRMGRNKKFEIDPEGAAIVQQVFACYAAGETQAEIVDSLNAQGLRTLRGRPFNHNSLRTVLKNEKYIGVYSYKDEVRIEGGIPAIIDPETFQKVQKMLNSHRTSGTSWNPTQTLLIQMPCKQISKKSKNL